MGKPQKIIHIVLVVLWIVIPLTQSECSVFIKKDYAYRHEVSGKVMDENNIPIQGAIVYRPEGLESLYKRITDEEGQFLFEYSGLGPEPTEEMHWTIIIEHPDYQTRQMEIRLPFYSDIENFEEYGYILRDLEIKLSLIE